MIILIFAVTKTGKRCTHFGYLCVHCTMIVYTLTLALNNYHSEPEAKKFSDIHHNSNWDMKSPSHDTFSIEGFIC